MRGAHPGIHSPPIPSRHRCRCIRAYQQDLGNGAESPDWGAGSTEGGRWERLAAIRSPRQTLPEALIHAALHTDRPRGTERLWDLAQTSLPLHNAVLLANVIVQPTDRTTARCEAILFW